MEGRDQEASISSRKLFRILTLTAAALALATLAMAPNPQRLPPGMRFHAAVTNHDCGAAHLQDLRSA